jgi:hypothetical protein
MKELNKDIRDKYFKVPNTWQFIGDEERYNNKIQSYIRKNYLTGIGKIRSFKYEYNNHLKIFTYIYKDFNIVFIIRFNSHINRGSWFYLIDFKKMYPILATPSIKLS